MSSRELAGTLRTLHKAIALVRVTNHQLERDGQALRSEEGSSASDCNAVVDVALELLDQVADELDTFERVVTRERLDRGAESEVRHANAK